MENNSNKPTIKFILDKEDLDLIEEDCSLIEFNKNLRQLICCSINDENPYEERIGWNLHHEGIKDHILIQLNPPKQWIDILQEGMNSIEFNSDGSAILSNLKGEFKIDSNQIIKYNKKIKFINDTDEIESYFYDCQIYFLEYDFFSLKEDLEDYALYLYRENNEYRYDRIEFDRYEFLRAYMERKYDYLNDWIKNSNDENEINQIKCMMESIEKRQDKFNLYLP
jgi:hypothetical protein